MLKVQGRAKSVKNLVSFDKFEDDVKSDAQNAGINLYHFDEVVTAGFKAKNVKFEDPTPESIAMFCYTSGTTGDPKAAMLSHKNLVAAASSAKYGGFVVTHEDVVISYLPLAHSFEKVMFIVSLTVGCKIGYYSGNVLELTSDCAVLKPTLFPSVPRLYSRIYDKIRARLSELAGMKSYLAQRAINKKLYYLENYGTYEY